MLRQARVVEKLNTSYFTIDTSERGGILSMVTVSGIQTVRYADNPSGLWAVGIQYNDVEYINLSRQLDPRRLREVDTICSTVGILYNGIIETDWIHVSGTIQAGTKAYAGPSGLITNLSTYGGSQIGYFLGPLEANRHLLIMQGKGFSTTYMERGTHNIVTENNPDNIKYAISDGFAKVRIKL